MPLANVALTDTFDTWRVRTNQIIVALDQSNTVLYSTVSNNNLAFAKANAANLLAFSVSTGANAYATSVGVGANTYSLTTLGSANAWANTVGTSANGRAVTIGAAGNSYASLVGASANSYADSLVFAATTNTVSYAYANTIGSRSNTWANTVGTSTNAFSTTVGTSSNAYARAVSSGSNTHAFNAFAAANSKVASISGSSGRIVVAGSTTPVINLATVAVTAGSYSGGISALTVDSHGRVTSITGSAGYPSATGSGASGTWNISITGSAASATTATSAGTFTATNQNSQFNSLGIGTAASGTAGELRATNNITAFYSDRRLKENIRVIDSPLEKLSRISGVFYNSNDVAASYGYDDKSEQVGVIAQEIQEVLPMAVKPAPFDIDVYNGKEYSKSGQNYLTVQYEKIIPLLIESIKELKAEIEELKKAQ